MSIYGIIFFVVIICIDIYIYKGFSSRIFSQKWQKIAYLILSIFTISVLLYYSISSKDQFYHSYKIFLFGCAQSLLFSKILLFPFLLLEDLFKLFKKFYLYISNNKSTYTKRKNILFKTGCILSTILFFSLIYGIAIGAYQIEKKYVEVKIPDLADELDGFKIIQVSDWHLGSYVNQKPVLKAVQAINEEQGDIFVFTGDLVNDKASEMLPYMEIMKDIQVKLGKYSVMGNHDYSPYIEWESPELQQQNVADLRKYQKDIHWNLLDNTTDIIDIEGKKLAIIGVEYWGRSIRWGQYGDIDAAQHHIGDVDLKILLSHDPSHWDMVISQDEQYNDIALTLSGHTHGFQFGIDLPRFKWSPSQWVYPNWAGLYASDQQYLYVNKGLGFLGFPGRVGMQPEITVITLKKMKNDF